MAWFTRKTPGVSPQPEGDRSVKTEGLWQKCDECGQIIWRKALDENMNCCPQCGHHFKIDAASRVKLLLDGDYEEFDKNLICTDPLEFVDSKPYRKRLAEMQESLKMPDALLSVDVEGWKAEAAGLSEYYDTFGDRLPAELRNQLAALQDRLSRR